MLQRRTEYIGMPEGWYPIAELSSICPLREVNSVGYWEIQEEINQNGTVPVHLMDANRDAKGFGHGEGYKYPHSFEGHWVPQQYLPDGLIGRQFYHPSEQGYEAQVAERLKRWREEQLKALGKPSSEENQTVD